MKPRNEGYALPLVLIVMLILCLLCVTVMTFAQRNLHSQKMAVTEMQSRYQAVGRLEETVAQLKDISADAPLILRENEQRKLCHLGGGSIRIAVSDDAGTGWVLAEMKLVGISGLVSVTEYAENGTYLGLALANVRTAEYISYGQGDTEAMMTFMTQSNGEGAGGV